MGVTGAFSAAALSIAATVVATIVATALLLQPSQQKL